jgi:hypothetical protein
MSRTGSCQGGNQRDELDMGTIIEFPADAASRRPVSSLDGIPPRFGIVLILPVIRIEREASEISGGTGPESGPEEGAAPGRRRRRR